MGKINVIRQSGGSRIMAVSKIIPADWQVVEVETVKTSKKCVTININKVK